MTDRPPVPGQMHPPYFFGGGDSAEAVQVTTDFATSVVELTVRGPWSSRLGMEASATLRKCLAQPPSAIIVDLHDLVDPDGASLPLWLAARRAAHLLQPPVQLALCLPAAAGLDRRLRRSGAEWHLFLFETMPAAQAAVTAHLPLAEQLEMRLPPQPASAAAARDLVIRACHQWHLPGLQDRARLVISELVANAVEHAGTEIWAGVSRRGTGLYIAVSDGVVELPEMHDPVAAPLRQERLSPRGRGLRLVHAGAAAWGAMPTRGGKVVWATVCPRKND